MGGSSNVRISITGFSRSSGPVPNRCRRGSPPALARANCGARLGCGRCSTPNDLATAPVSSLCFCVSSRTCSTIFSIETLGTMKASNTKAIVIRAAAPSTSTRISREKSMSASSQWLSRLRCAVTAIRTNAQPMRNTNETVSPQAYESTVANSTPKGAMAASACRRRRSTHPAHKAANHSNTPQMRVAATGS
ncbi:MAG: hypothetical protein BWY63_03324 [Chloroflexi bacterium ADurb.Bin360]|nr:MAG: hypothetical protein BWY63_03324 [Chloroflexi bacterium ADurb.Bin360]